MVEILSGGKPDRLDSAIVDASAEASGGTSDAAAFLGMDSPMIGSIDCIDEANSATPDSSMGSLGTDFDEADSTTAASWRDGSGRGAAIGSGAGLPTNGLVESTGVVQTRRPLLNGEESAAQAPATSSIGIAKMAVSAIGGFLTEGNSALVAAHPA
jgi:hypothetical protein